jgi:prophage regulatory protein
MKFLKLPAVMHLTQLSRSGIYAQMKEGSFPHQVKLGKRSVAWSEESISTWIKFRIEGGN